MPTCPFLQKRQRLCLYRTVGGTNFCPEILQTRFSRQRSQFVLPNRVLVAPLYGVLACLEHRFVLATDGEAVSLRELFDDLAELQRFHHPLESSVLTFEAPNGHRVTIIASKSGNRYRIQSDHLPSILPVLADFENRLSLFLQRVHSMHRSTLRLKVARFTREIGQ